MYLMYVDESGDSGIHQSPTRYFVLSALIVHELDWHIVLDDLISFRRHLAQTKRLKISDEIHASHFINNPKELVRIKRNDRLDILKQCIKWTAAHQNISIMSVVVDKNTCKSDVFEIAWDRLIQRFSNTITRKNFPVPAEFNKKLRQTGIVLPDNTDGQKLQKIMRRKRRYNPIPNMQNNGFRDQPVDNIIEDPLMKNSSTSLYIQMVDVIAYCARQLYEPNNYMKKKGAANFYAKLDNVLNKHVSLKHPLGIIEV